MASNANADEESSGYALAAVGAAGEESELCKLKASVPTGLEIGARDEVRDVLGRPAQTSRGRVVFSLVSLEELAKVSGGS